MQVPMDGPAGFVPMLAYNKDRSYTAQLPETTTDGRELGRLVRQQGILGQKVRAGALAVLGGNGEDDVIVYKGFVKAAVGGHHCGGAGAGQAAAAVGHCLPEGGRAVVPAASLGLFYCKLLLLAGLLQRLPGPADWGAGHQHNHAAHSALVKRAGGSSGCG